MLAYLFGILFQYFSVGPMGGLSIVKGLMTAVKIDTLSLVAYQVWDVLVDDGSRHTLSGSEAN